MKKKVSQFANMTSKTPILGDLEKLVSFMKTDEKLKLLTQCYRLTGKKTYKADATLFAQPATSKEAKARTTSGNSPTYLS